MSRNYHAAAGWDYDEQVDAADEENRLPLGFAVLSIVGLSALLWAAILAPFSLV